MFRKIAERLQLDKPLAYALTSRGWQTVSGPITIALIIRSLSEDEQGIYYGIAGVVGIQAFFELGLMNVLISQAGHTNAVYRSATEPSDRAAAEGRMRELIRASNRWFSMASVLFAASALAFGWFTFSHSDAVVDWRKPLLVIVPLAAMSVYFSPSLAILEGAGYRELIYRFRFYQMVSGSVAVWIALASGLAIWALAMATLVQTCCSGYLVLVHKASFFRQFGKATAGGHGFSWIRDVLPMQWRVAASSAAFHLATQFLAIVVLTFHTTAESGRLGMTLAITTAIQMLALAWVQTKFPLIATLHGAGNREQAGTLWRHTAIVSGGLLLLAFAGLIALIAWLPMLNRGWEDRFIEPWQLVVLGIGCLANHLVALQSFYVLARRANPLVVASVVGYLSTAAAVWIAGYFASTSGVVIAFAAGLALVTLPLHSWAYHRFRSRVAI